MCDWGQRSTGLNCWTVPLSRFISCDVSAAHCGQSACQTRSRDSSLSIQTFVWWPGSRTGSSPPWWSPPPQRGLLDTPSSAPSHLLGPPGPDWRWRSALMERHSQTQLRGQTVPEGNRESSKNTPCSQMHHDIITYHWATSWTATSSRSSGPVPAGRSSSLVTMVMWQLNTDWLSSRDLTSCVNSPLTFPSNSWKCPPRQPSTTAAERVNTCTNYRERGYYYSYTTVLQYYNTTSILQYYYNTAVLHH